MCMFTSPTVIEKINSFLSQRLILKHDTLGKKSSEFHKLEEGV